MNQSASLCLRLGTQRRQVGRTKHRNRTAPTDERAGTQANFQLSVVSLPAEDDEVIEEQGALVFIEPEAASLLDDKVLDASVEQNQVAFTIADQIEE